MHLYFNILFYYNARKCCASHSCSRWRYPILFFKLSKDQKSHQTNEVMNPQSGSRTINNCTCPAPSETNNTAIAFTNCAFYPVLFKFWGYVHEKYLTVCLLLTFNNFSFCFSVAFWPSVFSNSPNSSNSIEPLLSASNCWNISTLRSSACGYKINF